MLPLSSGTSFTGTSESGVPVESVTRRTSGSSSWAVTSPAGGAPTNSTFVFPGTGSASAPMVMVLSSVSTRARRRCGPGRGPRIQLARSRPVLSVLPDAGSTAPASALSATVAPGTGRPPRESTSSTIGSAWGRPAGPRWPAPLRMPRVAGARSTWSATLDSSPAIVPRRTARPGPRVVTSPVESTTATLLSPLCQRTARLRTVWPRASSAFASRRRVSPSRARSAVSLWSTSRSGFWMTITRATAWRSRSEAVIWAEPGPRATTAPVVSTTATLLSSLCQFTSAPMSTAPRRSVMVTASTAVSPMARSVSARGATTMRRAALAVMPRSTEPSQEVRPRFWAFTSRPATAAQVVMSAVNHFPALPSTPLGWAAFFMTLPMGESRANARVTVA